MCDSCPTTPAVGLTLDGFKFCRECLEAEWSYRHAQDLNKFLDECARRLEVPKGLR